MKKASECIYKMHYTEGKAAAIMVPVHARRASRLVDARHKCGLASDAAGLCRRVERRQECFVRTLI